MRWLFLLPIIGMTVGCEREPPNDPRLAQAEKAVATQLRDPGPTQFQDVREVSSGVFCGSMRASAAEGSEFQEFVYVQPSAVKPGDKKDIGPHLASDPANLPDGGVIPGGFVVVDYGTKYGC
jgi:hypothetical protein